MVNDTRQEQEEGARVRAVSLLPVRVGRGPVHHRAGQRRAWTRRAASLDERINARQAGNFILAPRDSVQYIDVSPKQLVSVAASLIPFLENDDANRALMGSNMQRQAVPLLRAQRAVRRHRHGVHHRARLGRGRGGTARRARVDYVDSQRIVVRVEGEVDDITNEMGADIYKLTKFKRSNQNTCINQKPIVRVGQKVQKGQVLADGPCTESGELALGRNVLVRVHAVARVQLRGRDPRLREAGQGGLLHLDPHRGVRDRGARHEARARGDHARHPERLRGRTCATSTRAASSASAPTSSRATSWSARSRRRARPS